MLNLKIHHLIHLDKEERYALHKGNELKVVGVAIPVWDISEEEPAKEFFCCYYLKNTKEDTPIKIFDDGFEITLPYREERVPYLSDDQWRDWSMNDPKKLSNYYDKCKPEISSKNLLDCIDGGGQFLYYREHNKMKKDDTMMNIQHFINIASTKKLIESLCSI